MMPIMMDVLPCTTDCWPCQVADCWNPHMDPKKKDPTCHNQNECFGCFMCGIWYNKCKDHFLACTDEGCNEKNDAKQVIDDKDKTSSKEDTYLVWAIVSTVLLCCLVFVFIVVVFRLKEKNQKDKNLNALTTAGGTVEVA